MRRIAFLALFVLAIFSSTATNVRAQDNPSSFEESRIEFLRSLTSLKFVAAVMFLAIVAEDVDCGDGALADSLEAAAREQVRHIESEISELGKTSPDFTLFGEYVQKALEANRRTRELYKECKENEKRYREQFASVPNIKDFGELKVGQTYRVASEYCWAVDDLRETYALYAASGRRQAVKLWRAKTAAQLCVEDSFTDATEFRVVKLIDTYDLNSEAVYIVEVVIGDQTAFLTSTVPVVAED